MASMWRRAMLYLGLGPDDEYDDHAPVHAHAPMDEPTSAGQRLLPPEPPEPHTGAVRTLPREREREMEAMPPPVRPRAGVVRPLTAQPASAKVVTVTPTSFNDAQEVADKFKAG